MGLGGGVQYETYNDDESSKNTPYFGSMKFGYGDIHAYAIELVLNYIDNKSNIFSYDDKQRYGLDVMFLKAFDITEVLYPFVRAGFGAGEMQVDRKIENKISYSSYNIGAGTFVPLTEHIDLEVTYEYRFTSFKSVDLIVEKRKLQAHVNQIYFGINYRF